jgi:sulfur relay (sulfurtransferase) complex TusBCD TusD component (DsrE family)
MTASASAPAWDLLLVAMGAPYADDTVSTMLRLADASAARGGRVQVWTCGWATMLTQRSLGATKPRNALEWGTEYPSSAAWVQDFLLRHEGRTRWLSCRFCSEERGALDHVPEVRVRPAMSFARHVGESAKTVLVGVN